MVEGSEKKILLVEDEKRMVEMYRRVFQRAGFEVEDVLTAEEAWENVQERVPDIILLDILLPEENGLSFLQKVRGDEKLKDIPVVILSNYDAADEKVRANELGVEAYLMKANFTPNALVEEVEKYLS